MRGYVIGSGWKDYRRTGAISGIKLPAGLRQAAKLPHTLFTPSTKAPMGEHDETISFDQATKIVGADLAARVRDTAIALYEFAAEHARQRGIIIADTKFEFAQDADGSLVLIDEVLTPDSSRFWPADTWREGTIPPRSKTVRARLPRTCLEQRRPAKAAAEVLARHPQLQRSAQRLTT